MKCFDLIFAPEFARLTDLSKVRFGLEAQRVLDLALEAKCAHEKVFLYPGSEFWPSVPDSRTNRRKYTPKTKVGPSNNQT